MHTIRKPAVAGMFYPGDPHKLRAMVLDMLATANANLPIPKAIIAPHAGYIYSGPVAAQAYACLAKQDAIKRVIMFGPAHRYPIMGLAAPQVDAFATPLGQVAIDHEQIALASKLAQVSVADIAHAQEHCLEVQLPFLQLVLKDFTLVPFVVGQADASQVAEVMKLLWDGDETLLVVSSDLSHYHEYSKAQKLDNQAKEAILNLDVSKLASELACGHTPIAGLLQAAYDLGYSSSVIAMQNSGDTAGSKDQVVGYGAFHFHKQTK